MYLFAMISMLKSLEFGLILVTATRISDVLSRYSYKREHESRADEWGINMMHKAGFDIDQAPKMIFRIHALEDAAKNLSQLSEQERVELMSSEDADLKTNSFFKKYPSVTTRYQDLKSHMDKISNE